MGFVGSACGCLPSARRSPCRRRWLCPCCSCCHCGGVQDPASFEVCRELHGCRGRASSLIQSGRPGLGSTRLLDPAHAIKSERYRHNCALPAEHSARTALGFGGTRKPFEVGRGQQRGREADRLCGGGGQEGRGPRRVGARGLAGGRQHSTVEPGHLKLDPFTWCPKCIRSKMGKMLLWVCAVYLACCCRREAWSFLAFPHSFPV